MRAAVNNVCNAIVAQDLCIGCGVCAGICSTKTLQMGWSQDGLWIPEDLGRCSAKCNRCLQVCPFIDGTPNEDVIGKELYGSLPGIQHRSEAGYCLSSYYAHANELTRLNGASGGLATWFLQTLLRNGVVDHIVCVKATENPDQLFKFGVFSTPEEVARCSKSAYYPVEISEALQTILRTDARYAVIGLPCVVKSLRLAQRQIPLLKDRIVVLAGLVCGQTKSKFFAEYLLSHLELDLKKTCYLSFRTKNPQRPASNFEVRARTTDGREGVCVWGDGVYAEAWNSGMFSPRPCGLCDDVFAELADVAFMDAWLPEYSSDWKGGSLLLTRSKLVEDLFKGETVRAELSLVSLSLDRVILSQQGVVDKKRRGLAGRLWLEQHQARTVPRKRVSSLKPWWFNKRMQTLQEAIRRSSFEAWKKKPQTSECRRILARKLRRQKRFAQFFHRLAFIRSVLSHSRLWTLRRIRGELTE